MFFVIVNLFSILYFDNESENFTNDAEILTVTILCNGVVRLFSYSFFHSQLDLRSEKH